MTAAPLPLFPNSVVSNDIDFITNADIPVASTLLYLGRSDEEMPGTDRPNLIQEDVYVFRMTFADDTSVEIFADADLASVADAQAEAEHFAGPLGKLPAFMRADLSHVVINIGDRVAFAEDLGRFIVVTTDNMAARRSTHDMEETIFHEAVHATLDAENANSTAWLAAQTADNAFITEYAAALPGLEDLPETGLFAHTYLYHPERLDGPIRAAMDESLGAKLGFFADLFGEFNALDGVQFGSAEGNTISGGQLNDTISGLAGDDDLFGSTGDDTLNGGAGDDMLVGGAGTNLLIGSIGNDLYRVASTTDLVLEGEAEGTDRVAASVDFKLLADQAIEALTTNGSVGTADINLTGNRLAQTITGNQGDNRLADGGGAGDVLRGLGGDDLYVLHSRFSEIREEVGQGHDRVAVAFDYVLDDADEIEDLTTTSAGGLKDIDLTGNAGRQRIYGNNGDNRLEGQDGRDLLIGRGGADTFVFASDPGFDNMTRIVDFDIATDVIELTSSIFAGTNLGTLKTGYFRASLNGQAYDASDRILYDTDSGYLFYDADGRDGEARTYFGRIDPGLALTADHFDIV